MGDKKLLRNFEGFHRFLDQIPVLLVTFKQSLCHMELSHSDHTPAMRLILGDVARLVRQVQTSREHSVSRVRLRQ